MARFNRTSRTITFILCGFILVVILINFFQTQTIPECSCERPFFYPFPWRKTLSTCSDEGTWYSTSQKVITFTFHLENKGIEALYKEGIEANLKLMRELYPGLTLRLYTDVKLEKDYCNFVCNNSDLFWCDITIVPSMGDMSSMIFRTWRFLPLGDPSVDYFLSRDLDSILTEREQAVVFDWLKVGKPIHLMRDDQFFHNIPILAGLWGARNYMLGENATKLREEIICKSKVKEGRWKGTDQDILNSVIFYPRLKDIVAYDSYHCKYWKNFTMVRPFPKERKDNVRDFTGNSDLGRAKAFNITPCPDECKPEYGMDWKYC